MRHCGAHIHMMMNYSRRACLHVTAHHASTNTSHVSNPSRSISPLRHVIDKAAMIFSALVLRCLCHRPLCDHMPPHPDSAHLSLHHSALSGMGQFISLLSWHFHLAPRCYISLTGGVNAAGGAASDQPTLTGCAMAAGFQPVAFLGSSSGICAPSLIPEPRPEE